MILTRKVGSSTEVRSPHETLQGIDSIDLQVLACSFLHDAPPGTRVTRGLRSWQRSFASIREIEELRDGSHT